MSTNILVETAAFICMAVVHSSALKMEGADSSQILYRSNNGQGITCQ